MKSCPLKQKQFPLEPCVQEKCEWWIKHDGSYGCAVTKIAPELFELRKWLPIIGRDVGRRVVVDMDMVGQFPVKPITKTPKPDAWR